MADPDDRGEMLYGALDMLILKALQLEPMHGWGITERIQQWSSNVLQVNQGSLYPSLYRLKRRSWITSAWQVTDNNRRARYYTLTPAGRKQLAAEHRDWRRLASAIDVVMNMSAP